MEKKPQTAADEASIADIRKKLAGFIRRPTTPAIAETVRVQITLAPCRHPAIANSAWSRPTASPIP